MKPTTLLTKSNKTHTMMTLYKKKMKEKKVKMFLSSLFNNYSYINTTHMTNKNTLQLMTTTVMKKSKLDNMSKRTLLWLGKEYDINSLYPWTQQQQKMTNPLLHIQKKTPTHKTFFFHTQNSNSEWTLKHPHKKHFFHYKMSFFTSESKNNTKLQLNLKHMSNNMNMKNTINNLYGKWSMQTMKQNDNMQSMKMMEHSKLKLLKTMHMTKKKMDSKNTLQKEEKKHQKGKMGYQKNEFLNSWSLLKDNFKICNIMQNKSNSNSMHLQQHSKLKY